MAVAFLKVIKGSSAGQVLALSGENVILGRHPSCQIVLDNASVSRQHAQILVKHGIFMVEDLRSRNGTQVNKQSIRGRTELRDGDEIRVCDYAFVFMQKSTGPSTPLSGGSSVISFDVIRETVSNGDDESEPELKAADEILENSSVITSISAGSTGHGLRLNVRPEAKLRAILEISMALGKVVVLEEVLPVILKSLFKIFPQADTSFVLLKDNNSEKLRVFVCYDSDDRLVATSLIPKAQVGEFAVLKVITTARVGSFLDWGLPKDLFLPFSEQLHELKPNEEIIVHIYLDKSSRISASMRLEKYLKKTCTAGDFGEGEAVYLLISGRTDLGYKAIVNGTHLGILFEDEVFRSLYYGEKTNGFIKKIRSDGKLDLSLQKTGHLAAEDIGPKILAMLNENKGFLAINEKSEPDTIYQMFGVSKKKYKIILGGLYRKRLISIDDDGIRLIKNPAK